MAVCANGKDIDPTLDVVQRLTIATHIKHRIPLDRYSMVEGGPQRRPSRVKAAKEGLAEVRVAPPVKYIAPHRPLRLVPVTPIIATNEGLTNALGHRRHWAVCAIQAAYPLNIIGREAAALSVRCRKHHRRRITRMGEPQAMADFMQGDRDEIEGLAGAILKVDGPGFRLVEMEVAG